MSASNYVNAFDGLDEPVRPTPGGRKHWLDPQNHKKQQKKSFVTQVLIPTVGCEHKAAATVFCQAEKLSPHNGERRKLDNSKLIVCNSVNFILAPINVYDNINNLLSQASAKTVSRVAQYYAETAEARPERRGGARHSEEHNRRRELIAEHIRSFSCRSTRPQVSPQWPECAQDAWALWASEPCSDQLLHLLLGVLQRFQSWHWSPSYRCMFWLCQVHDQDYRSKPNGDREEDGICIIHTASSQSLHVLWPVRQGWRSCDPLLWYDAKHGPSKNPNRTGLLVTADVSVPVWCCCAPWREQSTDKRWCPTLHLAGKWG